jgi:hypothetical protein
MVSQAFACVNSVPEIGKARTHAGLQGHKLCEDPWNLAGPQYTTVNMEWLKATFPAPKNAIFMISLSMTARSPRRKQL